MKPDSSKHFSSVLTLSVVFVLAILSTEAEGKKSVPAKKTDRGATLYMASCEPCHQTGGNMINPDKKIVNSDKIASEAVFKAFLSGQHAQMPPWKTIVRRDSDLKALYAYVRQLK
ncbi:MAG TPA: cytochrome c [Drouetiella sp.]|jgi:mono/diheme cytochrome c family protein